MHEGSVGKDARSGCSGKPQSQERMKPARKGKGPLGALKSSSKSSPSTPTNASLPPSPRPRRCPSIAFLSPLGAHLGGKLVVGPTTPAPVVGSETVVIAPGLRGPLGSGGRPLGPPQDTILDFSQRSWDVLATLGSPSTVPLTPGFEADPEAISARGEQRTGRPGRSALVPGLTVHLQPPANQGRPT